MCVWCLLSLCFRCCLTYFFISEDILEGSEAIVDAVDFITQDKQSGGARNSQVLQPTIATQNVSRCASVLDVSRF